MAIKTTTSPGETRVAPPAAVLLWAQAADAARAYMGRLVITSPYWARMVANLPKVIVVGLKE